MADAVLDAPTAAAAPDAAVAAVKPGKAERAIKGKRHVLRNGPRAGKTIIRRGNLAKDDVRSKRGRYMGWFQAEHKIGFTEASKQMSAMEAKPWLVPGPWDAYVKKAKPRAAKRAAAAAEGACAKCRAAAAPTAETAAEAGADVAVV